MIVLRQSMIDDVQGAGELEAIRPDDLSAVESLANELCCRGHIAGRGEMRAVVGEHGVHFVGNGLSSGLNI